MGDMELDAMDSYDEGDFDSGAPENERVENSTDRAMDETEAVMDILQGGDGKGYTPKDNDSGTRTRDIDSHGRVDYSRGESASQEPVQKESEYGISGIQTTQAIQHHEAEIAQAHGAYEKLQQMYRTGELTDQEFQYYSNVAGQHAGMHQRQLYENQIAQRDHRDQQRQAYGFLEQQFPGQFTEETRTETLKGVVDWMVNDCNLDPGYLRDVEDPHIIATAMKAMNAIKNDQEQRDTIAQLKGQVRRLKGARTRGLNEGRRASQAGVTGDKQDAMLNEVAHILSGEGGNGGRRR